MSVSKKIIIQFTCDCFNKANNKNTAIWKIAIFLSLALVVVLPSCLIRGFMLWEQNQNFNFMWNFIEEHIISNTGVGLRIAQDNPTLVYVLEGISSFVPVFIFLFSHRK